MHQMPSAPAASRAAATRAARRQNRLLHGLQKRLMQGLQRGLQRGLPGAACTGMLVAALAGGLAGCGSVPKGGPPASSPGTRPAPAVVQLDAEQRWLTEWFKGTPVVVVGDDDGRLLVEVPQPHCFEPEKSAIKPALAAVLDRVATSMRRETRTRITISVPADGNTALVNSRAAKVREYLYVRGVVHDRIAPPAAPAGDLVRLRLAVAPAAPGAAAAPARGNTAP